MSIGEREGAVRIFIAGATGILGRRVVPLLLRDGHRVIGLSRSDRNRAQLAAQGAEPRDADLLDQATLVDATRDCDAVLHLATAIPTAARPLASDWQINDRIRREGTRHLIEAALHHRCRLYLQQSIVFVYGDQGGAWVDETNPPATRLPSMLTSAVEMEAIAAGAIARDRLPGVTLRFGMFYAPDSVQTQQMVEAARRGFLPVIGRGESWWNLVHADDAARAVAQAVASPDTATGHTFNICEDEPVRAREFVEHLANLTGGPLPRRIPGFLLRWVLGKDATAVLRASVRCRNQLVRAELGWTPHHRFLECGSQDLAESRIGAG